VSPVTLPPGLAKLSARPHETGSQVVITIGVVFVTRCAAWALVSAVTTMTSTLS